MDPRALRQNLCGRRLALADMRRACEHPEIVELDREIYALGASLYTCTSRRPPQAPAPQTRTPEPAPMDWKELQERHDRDIRENPAHFKGAPRVSPEVPWTLKK